MSIGHPPVPYADFVAEQQAHTRTRELLTQERQAHAQTKRLLGQEQQRQQQRRKLIKSPWKSTEKLVIEEMQRQVDSPHATRDEQGFTRFCYKTAGLSIGTDEKTPKRAIEAIFKQCPDLPIETKEVQEPRPDGGRGTIKRLYIKPATEQSLISAAATATLSAPIKQGGNQYQCQNPLCLSHNVKIERQLVCMDCGHRSNLEPTFPNGKLKGAETAKSTKTNLSFVNPTADRDQENENDAPPAENFLTDDGQVVGVVIKPLTPPHADKLSDEGEILSETESDDITSAAELLLRVAGQDEKHIEMSRTGEKKYYQANRSLQLSDLVDHFRGGQARGALCSYQDGSTYALCFDADDSETWALLLRAARQLAQAGYVVILEESPAKQGERGGHMWILFDALVSAAAARAAALQIAPDLEQIIEYWPGPASATTWNRVRLPGGFYARYGKYVEQPVKAWCKLLNATTGETASDGVSAARLLLSSLTPAAVVPALPVISDQSDQTEACNLTTQEPEALACIGVEQEPAAGGPGPLPNSQEDDQASAITSAGAGPLTLPKVDARWIKDHGLIEKTTLWFAIVEEYAAAWYNEHHSLEEIRPRERNRMALSPNGNERTASTSYYDTAQGERFTDHSTYGRRADGTRESGDALELASKVQQRSKSAILSETTREIISQARADLESAARAGQPLPARLEEIVTPAGRRQYMKLLNAQGQTKRQEQIVTPVAKTVADQQPEPLAPAAQVVTELPAAAVVTRRIEESVTKLESPGQGEQKTALVEGQRVETPVGFATISSVRHCPILKRLRCSVHTDKVQPDGSRFAAFDVTQVQPISQRTIFSL